MPLACGNTVVLKASEICPATHRLIVETLNAAGLPRGVLNIVTHSGRRRAGGGLGADRPSQGQAHQLYRLHPGRADRRRAGGPASEAGAARARRQGAAGDPRRRRPRGRGQRGGLRRLHEPGPDLHVDREDRGRCRVSPTSSSADSRRRRRRCRTAIPAGQVVLGSVRAPRGGRADRRADRGCASARAPNWSPAVRPTARSCRRPSSTG